MQMNEHMEQDVLSLVRALPDDLINHIPILMVDRRGDDPDAFMRTENFIGYVEPETHYVLSQHGFTPAPEGVEKKMAPPKAPKFAVLEGEWDSSIDLTIKDANILGGNGRYVLPQGLEKVEVPIVPASAEHLAFYDCNLLKGGDVTRFNSDHNLPVTVTVVGEKYVDGYLLEPEKGGGAYLEVHDRPHFHMPLDPQAGGYLVLGKELPDGRKILSAFQVPYGYGVHMSPWVIHTDAYLVGRYMVIYSATPEFSTVILRKADGALASMKFET